MPTEFTSPAESAGRNTVNIFTKSQKTSEIQIAWSLTPDIDMNEGNDFYIDTTGATGEMTIGLSNVPASGTNQSGIITIKTNATYTAPTWNASFVNTPADLSSTETYQSFGYQVIKGSVILGSKVEWS